MENDEKISLSVEEAEDMLPRFDNIFFDLDGTLADTDGLNHRLYEDVFNRFGISISRDEWSDLFSGSRLDQALGQYLLNVGRPDLYGDIYGYFELHGDRLRAGLIENYGVGPVLAGLRLLESSVSLSKPVILCTSSRRSSAVLLLKKLGLDGKFNHIICGDEVAHGKPHPEIYLKAKELAMGGQCLVIEDSPNGLMAARGAECQCLMVAKEGFEFYA